MRATNPICWLALLTLACSGSGIHQNDAAALPGELFIWGGASAVGAYPSPGVLLRP